MASKTLVDYALLGQLRERFYGCYLDVSGSSVVTLNGRPTTEPWARVAGEDDETFYLRWVKILNNLAVVNTIERIDYCKAAYAAELVDEVPAVTRPYDIDGLHQRWGRLCAQREMVLRRSTYG